MIEAEAVDAPAHPPAFETGSVAVDGALLPFAAAGEGVPVVFLHGALADLRIWRPHQALLADRYRAVAFSQRYFDGGDWPADGPPFGVQTHAADLLSFVRKMAAGPVHLVAWSYAGHIALHAALQAPEAFRSLFLYEPGVPTYVDDLCEQTAFTVDARALFGPVFEAVLGQGDLAEGARRLLDGSSRATGYFDAQPPERRAAQLENARTLPLQLTQTEPPLITSTDLAGLALPVCVVRGAATRPLFDIVSRAALRCIPRARALVVPAAGHLWPEEDPAGFAAALTGFLASI